MAKNTAILACRGPDGPPVFARSPDLFCRDDEVAQSAMAPEALTIWTSGRGTVNPLSLCLPFPHKWWKGRMGNGHEQSARFRTELPPAFPNGIWERADLRKVCHDER